MASASGQGIIKDSLIDYCGWNCITLGGEGGHTNDTDITNVHAYRASDVGISIYGNRNHVVNCLARDCKGTLGGGSINSGWGFGIERGNDNLIEACTINNCDVGVGLSASYNTVHGLIATLVSKAVIFVWDNGDYCVFDGITARGCAVLCDLLTGNNVDITNNVCKDASTAAVQIYSGVTGTWIANNDFNGSTDDIADAGTNTTYGYNRWKDGSYGLTPP